MKEAKNRKNFEMFKLNTKEIFKSEEIDLSLPEEKENNN